MLTYLATAAMTLTINGVAAEHYAARAAELVSCEGVVAPPVIAWTGAPAGTRGFAVTLFDPDAPTDSGWWHWTVINLQGSTKRIGGANASVGTTLRNDDGDLAYGAPCPPRGQVHRYRLVVRALDVAELPLTSASTPATASFLARQHTIAFAEAVLPIVRGPAKTP